MSRPLSGDLRKRVVAAVDGGMSSRCAARRFLKKTPTRTKDDIWDAIARGIDTFTPAEYKNYFAAAAYVRQ